MAVAVAVNITLKKICNYSVCTAVVVVKMVLLSEMASEA